MPTFRGTDQADTIVAGYVSPGVSTVPAGSLPGDGNDTLYGYNGADTLGGGGGNDSIEGGGGDDSISGGNGNDYLSSVTADGSDGSDTMDGGSGNDNLLGGADADSLFGGAGADHLGGGTGSDTIDGGEGDDRLFGDSGNDRVLGGVGNDQIYASDGIDTLIGGMGDDYYYLSDTSDIVQEAAGGGVDTIRAEFDITLGANVENLTLGSVAAGYGNSLDNTMVGHYGATLAGGAGNDTYVITEYDSISIVETTGNGIDTVSMTFEYNYDSGHYDEKTYTIQDNLENLTVNDAYRVNTFNGDYIYQESILVGNNAANVIRGGAGSNTIFGSNGGDTLCGNEGWDTLDGGSGRDYLDGGAGLDIVLYTSNTTPVRVDLVSGLASFPGQNWDSETLVSIELAEGGSGNDIFIGNSDSNTFMGNEGNDVFLGGAGSIDTFYGGVGDDTFDGGAGQDLVYGDDGVDTVLYTSNTTPVNLDLGKTTAKFPGQTWASERIFDVENASTGSGADTLKGSDAANELHGMAGNDELIGGLGADRLVGGAGNDVFRFSTFTSAPGARDTIAPGDGRIAFQGAGVADGDRIDLSGYDADTTTAGVQDWLFGTSTAKRHLWVTTSGTMTIINGNVDDDAAIEFKLAIDDGGVAASAYKVQDFIL